MINAPSLDPMRTLIRDLPGPDNRAAGLATAREGQLTKPAGSLGRLEILAQWLCAWQGRHPPVAENCRTAVFAGNHGITAEGVSAFPAAVTSQMVANFTAGGAAINQLCAQAGCELKIYPIALDKPTENFLHAAAMTEGDCAGAMALGMASVEPDLHILCLGEMGIGNTTAAAALCHALFGGTAEDWVGPGTGVTGSAFENKIRVVRDAVKFHWDPLSDGLDILRRLGGREIAAMAGAILAARQARVPVILDGYVCGAAAATLQAMDKSALDHCVAGHVSAEPGHRRLLDALGMEPLLDLNMRLGEASGAALALQIVQNAVACHNGMATFGEAGISDKADE